MSERATRPFEPSTNRQVDPDPVVGIDLGTTNSLVAFCFPSGPRVLGGGVGGAIVPSVVRYDPDGTVVVGDAAKRGRADHGARTVASSSVSWDALRVRPLRFLRAALQGLSKVHADLPHLTLVGEWYFPKRLPLRSFAN